MAFGRKKTLSDSATQLADAIRPQVESAVEVVKDLAAEAREKAAEAIEKAGPVLAEGKAVATEKASAAAEAASAGAGVAAVKAREAAAVAAEKAREAAVVAAEKARESADLAAERASAGRDAVAGAAAAKIAQAKGEPPPSEGGGWKRWVLLGGLLTAGAVAYRKLRGRDDADNWESAYTPAPPVTTPASPAGAGAPVTDDPGGASPGEALSDQVEEPHESTTPDQPVEVEEIDQQPPSEDRQP